MEIKRTVFNLLSEIGYEVIDNPGRLREEKEFPFLLCRTTRMETKIRNGLKETQYSFLVDIFSKYEGEKEVYEIYEKVAEQLDKLFNDASVIRVAELGVRVFDDKSLGPVLKHGLLTFNVKTAVKKGE